MSDLQARTAATLARFATLAAKLGVDTSSIDPHVAKLGTAIGANSRIWLDSDGSRLGISCAVDEPIGFAPLGRPGALTVELETSAPGRFAIKRTVQEARTLAEDLAWLMEQGVGDEAREQLAERLDALGGRGPDLVGTRVEGDQTKWLAGFVLAGESPVIVASLGPILTLADQIGVSAADATLIEQAVLALVVPGGVAIVVACDETAALPQLAITVESVPWPKAVGLTDALRPGSPSAPRLGALAGAFAADNAAAMEITFRGGQPARVRIAADAPMS